MERSEKKAYLGKYVELSEECESLVAEYENLMTIATHITQTLSLVPGGGGSNDHSKIEECAVKMTELQEKIANRIGVLEKYRNSVVGAINNSPKANYRIILRYKYVSGLSNFEIAGELGKSERHVSRVLNKAVDSISIQL